MVESSSELLDTFESAIDCFGDSNSEDYRLYAEVALSSIKLSNLSSLNIPGSTLNSSGSSLGNRLSDSHILILTKGILAAGIQLEALSLTNHLITDKGFELICRDIVGGQRRSQQLHHLNLEGNNISGSSLSELCLQCVDCSLISLNLSHNALILSAGMTIADALRTNRNLQNIELNNCGFELNVIIAFGATLRQNSSLKTLNLDRPLTDKMTTQEEGVDHISRLLGSPNSCLEELCLRYHCIEDLGARLLAASLKKNKSLTYLDLERNKIGPAGCEALASSLIPQNGICCPLESLLLSYNRVGNEGAKAMADMLQSNTTLQFLSLKNNDIKDGGFIVLALSLRCNTTLQYLTIFGNKFTDGTGRLISELSDSFCPDLQLDIEVYEVDGKFLIAETEIDFED